MMEELHQQAYLQRLEEVLELQLEFLQRLMKAVRGYAGVVSTHQSFVKPGIGLEVAVPPSKGL